MNTQDSTPMPDVPQAAPEAETMSVVPAEPGRYRTLAVVSIAIAILAWVIAGWNGYAAMAAALVSIITGGMALRSHRHAVRNTAITSIIAAAVLLVVLAAFVIVIYLGLNNL